MIPYYTLPPLQIGPLHLNAYGLMFALGVLVASLLAAREARRRNLDEEIIWDLVFYLLMGIILGARLFYLLLYWPEEITLTFWEALAVWHGGLAFFGGFLGAIGAAFVFSKMRKIRFWLLADLFTVPLLVGHILGRLGDYLTGGHPGKITTLPWGIYLEGAARHPVVLYEILGLAIIVIILLNLKKRDYFEGFLFSSYVILYSTQRMILDFFRMESTDPRLLGLTPTQHLVVILFLLSLLFQIVNFKKRKVGQK